MNRRKTTMAAAVLLAAVGAVGGCASAPTNQSAPLPVARWVPSAAPAFATLARSTTYTLVFNDDQDLLVVEDDLFNQRGDFVIGRMTWLVPIGRNMPFDRPTIVGETGSRAWVIESRQNAQSHAAPARGTVTIHGMSAGAMTATLNLVADAQDRTAGVPSQPTVTLDGRYEFVRYTPTTPQYNEMATRHGIDRGAVLPTR